MKVSEWLEYIGERVLYDLQGPDLNEIGFDAILYCLDISFELTEEAFNRKINQHYGNMLIFKRIGVCIFYIVVSIKDKQYEEIKAIEKESGFEGWIV